MTIERYGVVALVPHPEDWKCRSEESLLESGHIAAVMACRFLVIRRAAGVCAPHTLCFAGGGIEPGETPQEAIIREYREELDLSIRVVREIWQSVTPWNVHLRWFFAELLHGADIHPKPAEVSEFMWMTLNELQNRNDLLVSNLPFFEELAAGRIPLSF